MIPSPSAIASVPTVAPPSIKFISAVVAVTPSRMFNSAVVEVTPSRMFNSAAVEVKAVPPIVTVEDALNVVNEPAAAVEPPMTVLSIVPPSMSGVLMSGEVNVLFVKVSVVALPTNVSVDVGKVTTTFPLYALWAADCNCV